MQMCLIGGGDTTPMLEQAIEATGNEHNTVLIIPSACSTEQAYDRKVAATVERFKNLKVASTILHELGQIPEQEFIDESMDTASMLYIIGGNSPHFTDVISQEDNRIAHGITAAVQAEKMLAGTSAGALAPFSKALINPAKKPEQEVWDFTLHPMLGILKAAATAHANQYDKRPGGAQNRLSRLEELKARFTQTGLNVGFGIDNDAALLIQNNKPSVIRSDETATVHILGLAYGLVTLTRCEDDEQLHPAFDLAAH